MIFDFTYDHIKLCSFYQYKDGRIDFYSYHEEYDKNGILTNKTEPKLLSSLIFEKEKELSFFDKIIDFILQIKD